MLDRADHYEMAFGDVPNLTLLAMAEKFAEVPRDLRAMFYAILAAPGDKAAYCALKDWLEAEVSLPDTVELPGGRGRVPPEEEMPWEWWTFRQTGLCDNIIRALWEDACFDGGPSCRGIYRMSVADIARMSAEDLLGVLNIGPRRLSQIRYWLGDMGLHLKGEEVAKRPPSFPPDDDEKSRKGPGDRSGTYWEP